MTYGEMRSSRRSQSNILDVTSVWKWYFNNNSRILFTFNTHCNISEIFKFQWYFKKMYSCLQSIMKFIIMKIFIMKILKISILRRLLWREFSCWRCNVCNTYLSVQIFVRVNWFRRVLAHACVISCLSRQRLLFFISAFFCVCEGQFLVFQTFFQLL